MRLRHRKQSIRNVLIDLTPLLDVVFIFLIVVLCYQDSFNSQADEKLAQAEAAMQEAESYTTDAHAQVSYIKTQLETYESINEYITVVTVGANYDAENRRHRTVRMYINDEMLEPIELNPSNEDVVWGNCKTEIESILQDNPGKPVILRFSTEAMLYRDECKIQSIFAELGKEDDVYVKYATEDEPTEIN